MARSPDRTVTALLAAAAARDRGHPLVEDEHVALTASELATRVTRAAAVFATAGIGGGDRVALWLTNSVGFVEAFLGVLACGAQAQVLAPVAPAAEVRRALAEAAACALVGAAQSADVAPPELAALAVEHGGLRVARALRGAHRPPRPPIASDPAFVAYSSGTTGRPQPVVRTHENLWWEAENIAAATDIGRADAILGVIPLSHSYGLGNALLTSLRTGARLVLRPRFLRRPTLDLLTAGAVTVFPTVPFMARMLATTDRGRRWSLDAVRLCISAGAPLTRDVYDAFLTRFGIPIRQLYGLTEAGDVALNTAPLTELDPTSVGRPVGTVRVTIEDANGAEVAPGATGEIVVRSDSAMGGAAQPLRTRDEGHWSERGDLVITGRTSLFINRAGNKVNPAEVEAVLRDVPGVRQVVVFGAPDRHRGQAVCACVVAARGVTRESLLAACGPRLAPFKVPRRIEVVDRIPVSARGKVERTSLLSLIARPFLRSSPTLHRN